MTRRKVLIVGMVSVTLLALLAMINFVYAQESGPQAVEAALGTAFTYQGQLKSGGTEVTGSCDMAFRLYDAATLGARVGTPITQTVTVNVGLFTTQLDFGASAFNGQARWLEIAVKCGSDAAFTTLTRQALTAAPYALYATTANAANTATSATTALTATNLSGALAGDVTGTQSNTTVTRLQGRNVSSGLPSSGTVLKYNGSTWAPAIDNDTTSVGGDLSGTQTDATVTRLQGRNVSSGLPSSGQVLKYNGSQWAPGTDDNTTYTAGSGLALNGTQFSVTGAPWEGLTHVPVGFADGVDNDTTYTAGDGLELIGTQFKMRGTSYQNVIIVAKSGGDYTTISAALTSITNASTTNHYLIKVMPGIYTETVIMKQYVDIEGAGELATTVTYIGSTTDLTGTVVGANNAELRFLTVVNTGGNSWAAAIFNSSASPHLTHVTALASGGTFVNLGVNNVASSAPTMMDVTATATGLDGTFNYGIENTGSSPAMTNVTATGSGGTYSYGVDNSSGSSPTMLNVIATGSGGTSSYGVSNSYASPTMTNVTATGSGGTTGYGMYNVNGSSPTMLNMIATGSGGTNSYGVYNGSSSLTVRNSVISASGGTNNYGFWNSATANSYVVTVNNSQVTGSTNAIRNDSEFATRVGASLLSGGAVNANGGTVTCAGVYDEAYAFYASTCP